MKKILFAVACTAVLTSCYNTRVTVGNVEKHEPLIEVSREWNHHLICGLVPLDNAHMNAREYTGAYSNYVIRTHQSFLNGLVGAITCGIYTPTSTVYYVPLKEVVPNDKAVLSANSPLDLLEE